MSSAPSDQHLAAILTSKGSPLEVTHRPTPTPGPDELLIEVKSIALNPIDYYQRDFGFAIETYPAVPGSDVAGVILSAGSSAGPYKSGMRVAAFAPCFFMKGAPDYGAFQTRVLVPAAAVVPLPMSMSFNEGSLLPMAVQTTWSGWYSVGLPRDTPYTPDDRQGMLVWGGASSVGSAALQVARLIGFSVYVTASEKHHEYMKSLGARRVFDYRDEDVVSKIVRAAKDDGVILKTGFDAAGETKKCIDILKEFKGDGTAKLAEAKPLSEDSPQVDGVQVAFVLAPADRQERLEYSRFVFGVWLKEKLETGEFVPSPKLKVVEGGLQSVNKALDELKAGVSGTKLVLEV